MGCGALIRESLSFSDVQCSSLEIGAGNLPHKGTSSSGKQVQMVPTRVEAATSSRTLDKHLLCPDQQRNLQTSCSHPESKLKSELNSIQPGHAAGPHLDPPLPVPQQLEAQQKASPSQRPMESSSLSSDSMLRALHHSEDPFMNRHEISSVSGSNTFKSCNPDDSHIPVLSLVPRSDPPTSRDDALHLKRMCEQVAVINQNWREFRASIEYHRRQLGIRDSIEGALGRAEGRREQLLSVVLECTRK